MNTELQSSPLTVKIMHEMWMMDCPIEAMEMVSSVV